MQRRLTSISNHFSDLSSYTTFFGSRGLEFEVNDNRRNTPPRFVGTSCSVANVAAVGVILLQAISYFSQEDRRLQSNSFSNSSSKTDDKGVLLENGFLLPYDVYDILEETAIDMNEPGFDFLTGYGFINAFAAVETIKDRITATEQKKSSKKLKSKSTKKSQKSSKKSSKNSRSESSSESCIVEDFTDPIEEFYDEFTYK